MSTAVVPVSAASAPRLLDQVQGLALARFARPEPGERYACWARRYVLFHGKRHPRELGVPEPEEVRRLLEAVRGGEGVFALMAGLLYGAGLRREECCRLRVHDMDMGRRQIIVRHGKGGKDRVVMLPKALRPGLERQLLWRRELHERDLRAGLARVALPDALARKYPRAAQELGWQFLFASRQRSRDPKTGDIGRHHIDPGSLARAVGEARRRAGLVHRVGCHTLAQLRDAPG